MFRRGALSFALLVLCDADAAQATSCADSWSETALIEIESVSVDGKPVSPTAGHRLGPTRVYVRWDGTLKLSVRDAAGSWRWEEDLAP